MNRVKQHSIASVAFGTGLVLCLGASMATVQAGAVTVPDGDFTVASGAGSVGGGGLIAPGGSTSIGSGPWTGTYTALLGILAPPTLTISTTGGDPSGGRATISGIAAGLNLAGQTVDTTGSFSQTLNLAYAANTTYTLTASVNPGMLLNAGVSTLNNSGVGIGLTGSSGIVASSSNGQFLNLSLLDGTNYQLTVRFTTGSVVPSGNIGISLYDSPSGLLQANVLGGVSFSNVTLDASAAPEPSSSVLLLLGGGFCALAAVGKKGRKGKTQPSTELAA
jgi:hypothetical protein